MPGKLVHFELPAQDAGRARDFWGGLFGWSFSDPGMPGVEYWMVRTGEDQGGAIYPADKPGPIIYFDTDDIDGAVAKARELGGRAEDKQPIPGVGWFARCADSEGNEFSLFQRDESVTG
jgi:predicted enzyme related to lactoylglutathione lyase